MDYLCAKFGDFSFSRFGFIVCRQTDRITEADQRYTHATTNEESRTTMQFLISVYNYTVHVYDIEST